MTNLTVYVRAGEPIAKALRKLARKVGDSGLQKEMRRQEYALSKGQKKKRAKHTRRLAHLRRGERKAQGAVG